MYLKKAITPDVRATIIESLKTQVPRLANSPSCDFCGNDDPIVVYANYGMSTGEQKVCWRWCACASCELLVDNDSTTALKTRIKGRLRKMVRFPVSDGLLNDAVEQAWQMWMPIPEDK